MEVVEMQSHWTEGLASSILCFKYKQHDSHHVAELQKNVYIQETMSHIM